MSLTSSILPSSSQYPYSFRDDLTISRSILTLTLLTNGWSDTLSSMALSVDSIVMGLIGVVVNWWYSAPSLIPASKTALSRGDMPLSFIRSIGYLTSLHIESI